MKQLLVISLLLLSLSVQAQDNVEHTEQLSELASPIESLSLQGKREATAEEKAFARRLAEEREEQIQINNNLPLIDENGQVLSQNTFYFPHTAFGWNAPIWQLHNGLNVNVNASVFANFGNSPLKGAGFTQDVSLMYVSNLSKKATLAIGGYIDNVIFKGNNYTTAGINAVFGYRFNEHWSAYAFVQKSISSDNAAFLVSPYRNYMSYGLGYMGDFGYWMYPHYGSLYGMSSLGYVYNGLASRMMDRIGAGVTYQWGEGNRNVISISVEYNRLPSQRDNYYQINRYDYPVR